MSKLPMSLVLALLLVLTLVPAVSAEEGADGDASLPLVRVALFTSGVGFFEHRDTIEGDQRVDLTFNVEDVNDLLKSMVVQDLGGGRISTVTYGSRDPVAKTLQSFAIDLTENLTLADLFRQIRGEAVRVETTSPIQGTILSVQTRPVAVGDQTIQADHLNLLTQEGIRSLPFDSIRSVRLLDARLDQEMREALETLSRGRDNQKKTVTLDFQGDGERAVIVGYVQATPVWKTSYRLVLEDEGRAYLQGWAIVENTTNRDWKDVDLSLVSGAPVSFEMNLYESLYAKRPVVEPELRPGVAPQRYERDMGPVADALAEMQDAGKSMDRAQLRRARGAPAEGFLGRPGAPQAEEARKMELRSGATPAASGAEIGELFEYRIDKPVTLARQRSAMIPIVGQDIQARKVSIFDPAVQPQHPLHGVELDNDTPLYLMQGPVTVFDGGVYAGDALLGDLAPAARRLLTYALDMGVEVAMESQSRPDEMLTVRVVKGVLWTSYRQQRRIEYRIRNDDAEARKLLIAQPLLEDWTLLEPKEPAERTRSQYRFAVDVGPNESAALVVVEERTHPEQIALTNLRDDRIAFYLRATGVSTEVKQALQELVQKKLAIAGLGRKIQGMQRELEGIAKEQDRIRQNMAQIDHASDLYVRYLKDLGEQENRIDVLRKDLQRTAAEQEASAAALDAWLANLTIN